MPRTVAILQPGYLPWLGFFDQLRRADVFVMYDDVQYDKHGWRNRNRIKGPQGPHWLTVPVFAGDRLPINQVTVDNRLPWARKHIGTIQQFYARSPHLKRYLPQLEEVLTNDWNLLVDLNRAVLKLLCDWLDVHPTLVDASTLGISGGQSERLLRICQHFGATHYLSGNAASAYLDVDIFCTDRLEVVWQNYTPPVYTQLHGDFISHLSVLDLILNCGDDARFYFKQAE